MHNTPTYLQPRLLEVDGVELHLEELQHVGVPQGLERQNLGAELQEGALHGLWGVCVGGELGGLCMD